MRSYLVFLALALALPFALTACASNDDPVEKGAEEAAPIDGKSDSFYAPTEHGTLLFDTANQATIDPDQRYHAWEFTLTGDANVTMTVSADNVNLDTVMYLYRRTDTAASWGSYIERNDDYGDLMQSQIAADLDAADYRVLVKGYKEKHRGPFSLMATCEGDGCGEPVDPDSIVVPSETSFTDDCAFRLEQALGGEIVTGTSFAIDPEATSGFDLEVLVATAHYDGMSDWREYVYDDEEFTFDVNVLRLESGTTVEMSDGGDESTVLYAFDADGELLAYYLYNQSPWAEYFCGQAGEVVEEPHEDCLEAWMTKGPHVANSSEDASMTVDMAAPPADLDPLLAAALDAYTERIADGDEVVIDITYTTWLSSEEYEGKGADMLLSSAEHEVVSYTVVEAGWGDPWVVFESSENSDEGLQMICIQ